jgi:hypothetical protein
MLDTIKSKKRSRQAHVRAERERKRALIAGRKLMREKNDELFINVGRKALAEQDALEKQRKAEEIQAKIDALKTQTVAEELDEGGDDLDDDDEDVVPTKVPLSPGMPSPEVLAELISKFQEAQANGDLPSLSDIFTTIPGQKSIASLPDEPSVAEFTAKETDSDD